MPLDNLDLFLHIFDARLLPFGTSDRNAEDARKSWIFTCPNDAKQLQLALQPLRPLQVTWVLSTPLYDSESGSEKLS